MNHGDIPETLPDEPYPMVLKGQDFHDVAAIINQGIDGHLEAVFSEQSLTVPGKITILDGKSMRCFIRRCMESGNENLESMASAIMETLGIEWI